MSTDASFELLDEGATLIVRMSGDWATEVGELALDVSQRIGQSMAAPGIRRVTFDVSRLENWGTGILVAVSGVIEDAASTGVDVRLEDLPDGVQALVKLARAVPPRAGAERSMERLGFLELLGRGAVGSFVAFCEIMGFLRESLNALGRLVVGRARFRRRDVIEFVQSTGPEALPIVGIINLLLGVILAFMGAVQLTQFGAEIYAANLVALGQTREIAPMMTAIVMAGRTGAAYAAQLGTMQVNEEIDAFETFGFSPMDYLVLPRMLALAVMFPLLVLYADALGILGGYLVGVIVLGLGAAEYVEQTRQAIGMGDVFLGLVKGSVFGVLVAVTGCMQGMRSGRSASAVGEATTQAVVMGIIAIIVMTAVFAVLTNLLGV